MKQADSILQKAYDLLKKLIALIRHFPRDQKFLTGDRMQALASEILELLIAAYYSPRDQKKKKLDAVNIKLEQLRFYARLCFELGFYASPKYEELIKSLQEIGRMAGGWRKTL